MSRYRMELPLPGRGGVFFLNSFNEKKSDNPSSVTQDTRKCHLSYPANNIALLMALYITGQW